MIQCPHIDDTGDTDVLLPHFVENGSGPVVDTWRENDVQYKQYEQCRQEQKKTYRTLYVSDKAQGECNTQQNDVKNRSRAPAV